MNYLSQALLVFTQNPHFYFYKNYPNFLLFLLKLIIISDHLYPFKFFNM